MRKILNNKKSKRITGTSKGRIGLPLYLLDKNRNKLCVGDTVLYGTYRGILLYNYHIEQYGVALEDSMWYGTDKYSIDSYGKFVPIPMDNGARMLLEKINE